MRNSRPDLDVWQAFQKGLAYFYRPYSDADHAAARKHFDSAIELDPEFSDAHTMIAMMGIYALEAGADDRAAQIAVVDRLVEQTATPQGPGLAADEPTI